MNKIVSFFVCLLFPLIVSAQSKPILVVDAGHGGKDPGALSASQEVESDWCFDMANVLADYAKQNGFNVVLTRKRRDEYLTHQKRSGFKRDPKAMTYFVSLHLDHDKDVNKKGSKIYYYSKSTYGTTSRIIAEKVANGLERITHDKPKLEEKDAVVLIKNEMPAVMVYSGFMTNKQDYARAKNPAFQKQLAAVIVKAVSETKY